jgi:membrane glycosyltransferase
MDQVSDMSGAPSRPGAPAVDEYPLLPADAPLDMPVQSLRLRDSEAGARDSLTLPRAALLLVASIGTGTFAYLLYRVLSVVQLTVLQAIFLVLSTLCFAWIALGTSSAMLGFLAALVAGRRSRRALAPTHRQAGARHCYFPSMRRMPHAPRPR